MKKKNREVTVRDIIKLFLPKIWIMLLVSVVLAGGMAVYSSIQKPTYTSSTLVFVQKTNTTSMGTSDIEVAEKAVETFRVAIYEADRFLNSVAENVSTKDQRFTSSSIRSMMEVVPYEEAPYLRINVTYTDREIAFKVLDQISILSVDMPKTLNIEGLQVTIVDSPSTATENSKNVVRNAVIAFVLGFVLTMVVIWIKAMFDVTIKTADKIEEHFDIPVLAVIPSHDVSLNEGDKE